MTEHGRVREKYRAFIRQSSPLGEGDKSGEQAVEIAFSTACPERPIV
jgi:hypothetical protein